VIAREHGTRIDLDRAVFADALKRAAILTSDKFKGVRLTLSSNTLKVQTTNTEQEEAVEELDVDYDGEALDIGFNITYLLDVLGNLKTEQVTIEFGGANSSTMISVPGDDSFKYVVMPMRL
jgi:DNA polymerase-3 subunit beta